MEDALETAIAELANLVAEDMRAEQEYQALFERHPVIFTALNYRRAIPHTRLVCTNQGTLIPDFLAERLDGLFDIFELKTPQEQILKDASRRQTFYASLHSYIAQVQEYAEYFADAAHRQHVLQDSGLNVQPTPDMVLVAGRDIGVDVRALHKLERRQAGRLSILTYDQVIDGLLFRLAAMTGRRENLAGDSLHLVLRVRDEEVHDRAYLFDVGLSSGANRWSLYLDHTRRICLEVIDRDGRGFPLNAAGTSGPLSQGAFVHLSCEFGIGDGFALLQLRVNNQLVARQEIFEAFGVDARVGSTQYILGNDLTGQQPCHVDIAEVFDYGRTLEFSERIYVNRGLADKYPGLGDSSWEPAQYVEFREGQMIFRKGAESKVDPLQDGNEDPE